MRTIDIIAALVLLGLSALVAGATWHLPYWSTFTPGPSFAPVWVALAGALIGSALLITALRQPTGGEAAEWPDAGGLRQVVLGIACLWALFFALPFLGIALSGTAFMLIFLLGIFRRPLLPSLITTAVTIGLIEGIFVHWLHIDLPRGPFGF